MKAYFYTLFLVLWATYSFAQIQANCDGTTTYKVLLAGDSWAQYMGDDASYNDVFHRYGHSDKKLITQTLDASPTPPYIGTAYAISGSEAREWANTAVYPYIQNMVDELNLHEQVQTVVLSIGGNDVLAGKSDGGWYKDMDLDVAGSEQALFNTIENNTLAIIDAAKAVRPDIEILMSSYEYPNFDVGILTCWIYACPKREDLSRDPLNDLITNTELNQMMITVEAQRQAMVEVEDRVVYDNSIGLMHHYYGDGNAAPGTLAHPLPTPPYTPGGNPLVPTLRENFRITGDPIHLDYDAYQYKIKNQMDNFFFEKFRGNPDATFFSEGGDKDGWVDVVAGNFSTNGIKMGDDGFFPSTSNEWRGILSFNTENLPDNAVITGASIYLNRSGEGFNSNPFDLEDRSPKLDIVKGTFGNAEVELSDGTATADAVDVGCFHGTVPQDYYANRIDIHPSFLEHINKTGRTQFRMYFDLADWAANYVNYFDGSENASNSKGEAVSGKAPKEIIYQEKMIDVPQKDGTVKQEMINVAIIPHYGLADLVETTAPFMDISFSMPLPIALSHFSAVAQNSTAILEWTSEPELKVETFYIERSKNGKDWEKIGIQPAYEAKNYTFTDFNPFTGENYYRLQMKQTDGTLDYSQIRNLTFELDEPIVKVYPNPFNKELIIDWSNESLHFLPKELVVSNMLGQEVLRETIDEETKKWQLERAEKLERGTYALKLLGQNGEVLTIKVMKL